MRYKINKLFIVVSIILGIITGVINEIAPYGLRGILGGILAVTLSMAVMGIISALVLIIRGNVTNSYARFGKMAGLGFLMLLLFIGSTALFEFIYEQDINIAVGKDSDAANGRYVFLIDDSGSMQKDAEAGVVVNDINGTRFDVVEDFIKTLSDKSEFAVYLFANETTCITPMGSVKPSEYVMDKTTYGGGTYMLTALEEIVDEVGDPQKPTIIVTLTDGEPHDADYIDRVVAKCNENNMQIDAIGFGNPDSAFMTNLATRTGGTYSDAGDVNNLADTMANVVNVVSSDGSDLLGKHHVADILHIIMRIVFLILMALIFTIAKELFIGDRKYNKTLAIVTFVIGALAAVLFEVMMLLPIPALLARLMLYGAWGTTLIPDYIEKKGDGVDLGNFDVGQRKTAYDFGQEFSGSGTNSFI